MSEWKTITGSEIIDSCIEDDKIRPLESVVEDAYKQNWLLASEGELKLLKLYYTDGFGWYFNRKTKKLTFVLHECKVLGVDSEFKAVKLKSYITCIKKALLQAIGYYNKIKNRSYSSFSKELKALATSFNFSTKNASIGSFNSAAIDIICTIFMFLSGINFSLFYYLIIKKFNINCF